MDAELLRTVLIATTGGALFLWLASSLLFRVTGVWERELSDDERREGARPERVSFTQLGPFVSGRREVPGGFQEFSGFVLGRTLHLKRRDRGVQSLVRTGFPEPVAAQLEGEVAARLQLRMKNASTRMVGNFAPQKIEFTHQPPRVTAAYFLAPQPRSYRRVVAVEDEEAAFEPTG